jgi:hypothetical protein
MVIHLFCLYKTSIDHPLRALALFLHYYSNIEWETQIVSISHLLSIFSMEPYDVKNPLDNSDERKSQRTSFVSLVDNMTAVICQRYEETLKSSRKSRDDTTTATTMVSLHGHLFDSWSMFGAPKTGLTKFALVRYH